MSFPAGRGAEELMEALRKDNIQVAKSGQTKTKVLAYVK